MNKELLQLLLPEGLLEYFEFVKVENVVETYNIYISERNIIPSEYEGDKLESKGFFDEETVRDFPLRGKPCFLKIKRRKWLNHNSGKIVYRNWEIVANGTRMTTEFATFLKGAFR
ncbi:transposase [Lacihabitans sp. LS3-19]|uniref:ISAon1 family transposase N-terminal region protein n=1 Tax=Lacihabitans sp. LS3-19 TaxID=2487335 RepID=UPI0020CF55F0|nr:transposase [Lacihabitans sp. LS3-19]MCP9769248.1 transposase [Lacihabitans sp. LS3-19]